MFQEYPLSIEHRVDQPPEIRQNSTISILGYQYGCTVSWCVYAAVTSRVEELQRGVKPGERRVIQPHFKFSAHIQRLLLSEESMPALSTLRWASGKHAVYNASRQTLYLKGIANDLYHLVEKCFTCDTHQMAHGLSRVSCTTNKPFSRSSSTLSGPR